MTPADLAHVHPIISVLQRDILIAAAAGSSLSLLFLTERFTWKLGATAILSGLVVAFYGVQAAARLMHIDTEYCAAISALVGFSSMTVLSGILHLLRLFRDDPSGFLRQFLPFLHRGDP